MSDKFELEIDPDFSKHASLVCPESGSRYLHIEKVYDYDELLTKMCEEYNE